VSSEQPETTRSTPEAEAVLRPQRRGLSRSSSIEDFLPEVSSSRLASVASAIPTMPLSRRERRERRESVQRQLLTAARFGLSQIPIDPKVPRTRTGNTAPPGPCSASPAATSVTAVRPRVAASASAPAVWAPSLEIPSLKSDAKLAYILDALYQLADPRLQVPDLLCSEHVPGRLTRATELQDQCGFDVFDVRS
jgi:hypothetical protein